MSLMPMMSDDPEEELLRQYGGGLLGATGGGLLGAPQQIQGPQSFGQRLGAGLKSFAGNRDLALALLANSGYGPKQSFGQVLGKSALMADQMGQQRSDDAFKRQYMTAQMAAMNRPANERNPHGQYQPGDYTPASWAKFVKSNNPEDLERYVTPRQETAKPFQNITRTYPDGSTQQGSFDARTGEFIAAGPVVPAGTKPRVDAQGAAEGKIAGDLAATAPRAYETFKVGAAALENAMAASSTGPVMGRLPAVTAAQQTAEGAEATMAPVLKQLFRQAGEGTFTDQDQAMLMKMIPTRQDHPETRKAKLEMIDSIVKAKLGITDGAPAAPAAGQPPFQLFPNGSTSSDGWQTLPGGIRVREKK